MYRFLRGNCLTKWVKKFRLIIANNKRFEFSVFSVQISEGISGLVRS
jgi:hypothetical protein